MLTLVLGAATTLLINLNGLLPWVLGADQSRALYGLSEAQLIATVMMTAGFIGWYRLRKVRFRLL
jgi:hypothetical protein